VRRRRSAPWVFEDLGRAERLKWQGLSAVDRVLRSPSPQTAGACLPRILDRTSYLAADADILANLSVSGYDCGTSFLAADNCCL